MTSSTTRAFMAKKQSTSFTQVATNLLNVLQGYTKGIRLVAVLTMLFTVGVGSMLGATTTYTFTTKSWGDSSNGWTSGKAGNELTSNQGVQVTTGVSGANATTKTSFTNVSSVAVQYCTNAKAGTGTIKIQVGSNSAQSFSVSAPSSGGTTLKTKTFTFSPNQTGTVKISVDCTKNSIYINSVTITTTDAVTCNTAPTVSAASSSNITTNSATVTCSGGITSLGSAGCSITSYGFVYGTSSNPTISNTKVQVGTSYTTTGTLFSKSITGLSANTTYYVRPYATNGYGTAYGTQTTFKTSELPKYTVSFSTGSGNPTQESIKETVGGAGITLPTGPTPACSGWEFAGWATSAVATETSSKPATLLTGTYKPASNITLYAVYKRTETTEGTPTVTTTTDKLTRETTGVDDGSTTYSSWSGKTVTSSAVYAGNSAGSNNSIQLRSNNSNSGVITTDSGGKVTKITVVWNSNTADGRTLDIYGKKSAYSAATDLYSTSTQGTKLGSIAKGNTTLTITDDYEYIGLRSNSGAMYLTSISIEWETSTGSGTSSTTYYHSTPQCNTETSQLTKPKNGETSDVTTTTAKLVWDDVDNASSYTVKVTNKKTNETKTYTSIETNYYNLTDLTPATTYKWTVQAIGDGVNYTSSDVADGTDFTTDTPKFTITLNPNGGSFASTPTGWTEDGNNYKKENVTGSVTLPTPTKTGYNFDVWYDGTTEVNSPYTPSETVTLVANWTAKTTNITLNANTNNHGSGSDSSVKATYNQALPNFTPCTPATGYTLNGYFTAATSGTKIIDKDGNLVSGVSGYTSADGKWANEFATLTLYAQYVASQYTVTFVANGGTGTMAPQTFTHGVSQPLSANQFTREHYTFKGWTINQDGSGHLFEDQVSTVISSSPTILYAQWTPIEYVIILDANQPEGHVPSSPATNAEGLLLPHAFPSVACKQDWTFAGWSETDVTEETTTAPTTLYTEGTKYNPTRNITLYAVFSKTDEAFGFTKYEKVTSAPSDWSGKYLISNGTQTATGTQFSNSALAIANFIPGTDEKTEYEFTISKNGNNENYYILSPDGTYYVGGTTGSSNKADLIFSDNPNEDKYLWNLSASDPMTKNNASDRYIGVGSESSTSVFKQYSMSGTNAKCYLYKRIEETSSTTTYNSNPSCVPTHTITWMNGDDVLGQDKVEEGKTPEYAGDEPTKAADAQYTYTFNGWTPEIVAATEDATYTATYTETLRNYTITWKNGETTLETDNNVPYGETPTYDGATPTKAATAQYTYTFKGWSPEVTSVTGDATYTATFTETVNKYQVTFNMNGHGTAPATQTIAYGSKVSEPSAPTADGYKFAGWYKDEQCTIPWNFGTDVITGNTTIHAKWLQIFTITWKANAMEYTTTNVTEGEPITPPASPDPGDYCGQVFAGWTTAEMEGTANVAPTLYPNPTPFPTATKEAPKTYYAVFADYDEQQ